MNAQKLNLARRLAASMLVEGYEITEEDALRAVEEAEKVMQTEKFLRIIDEYQKRELQSDE